MKAVFLRKRKRQSVFPITVSATNCFLSNNPRGFGSGRPPPVPYFQNKKHSDSQRIKIKFQNYSHHFILKRSVYIFIFG